MDPQEAGESVRRGFGDPKTPVTVADVAVKSGLALRDAESGLTWLTKEYRGHLRVTEDGQLLYFFPQGFEQPWIVRERWQRIADKAGRAIMGTLRFVVRAWLLIALSVYALAFLAILLALSQNRDRNDSRRGGGAMSAVLFRALFEAMFWTFHPFSPFSHRRAWGQAPRRRNEEPSVPLYEKVNRFVFGPTIAPADPQAKMANLLAAIRSGKGRIGLSDVLRVTGLPREEADAMMASLMLDYEGDVEVGEQGGIYYRFEALRKTAEARGFTPLPPAAWEAMPTERPLTGNTVGANLFVGLLNGFNLAMSTFILATDLTLVDLLIRLNKPVPPWLPTGGVPLVFGIVPLVLSLVVFAIPLVRAVARPWKNAQRARERGRLAMLREILERAPKAEPVDEDQLRRAYRIAAGSEPSDAMIRERIVELGGDVDLEGGEPIKYRFPDLEEEAAAVAEERERADDDEAKVGAVVFTSEI